MHLAQIWFDSLQKQPTGSVHHRFVDFSGFLLIVRWIYVAASFPYALFVGRIFLIVFLFLFLFFFFHFLSTGSTNSSNHNQPQTENTLIETPKRQAKFQTRPHKNPVQKYQK